MILDFFLEMTNICNDFRHDFMEFHGDSNFGQEFTPEPQKLDSVEKHARFK